MNYKTVVNEKKDFFDRLSFLSEKNNSIESELYDLFGVKRGLRNQNGTGVLVGLTEIGDVRGYVLEDETKVPIDGELYYRGIELKEFVSGYQKDKRFGYEECIYLLMFGELPDEHELERFEELIGDLSILPPWFKENRILTSPSKNIMNHLQSTVLSLYSYDDEPDDLSVMNLVSQCLNIIAKIPVIAVYSYQAKRHNYDNCSLVIHNPDKRLSIAENILHLLRSDKSYTRLEAETLDLSLVVHAEHGGGNNSTFSTHVVSSSGTDTYSIISSAIGSLKGPKHGGANLKVYEMLQNIKENIKDYSDKDAIRSYLIDILDKKAFDKQGLIYGMGHAIYTKSDPRAVLLKAKAKELAEQKGRLYEFDLYENIEEIAKELFKERKGGKVICANVDLYSSFVYQMLGIPNEMYTPLFAIARMSGWCAHRIEQILSDRKIIRPAYKNILGVRPYKDIDNR